ncbi:unnamed protein product [Symbiodinium natans]|uniref:Uncharacterized protein n=1 Tax=Symbiodinium natans TaxID=878477 RepID=A0A812QRQ5_9DINO|nr:unnamed protein product [Symbiodinium natans]
MAGLQQVEAPGRQARSKRPRTQNAGESGSEQMDQQIKQLGNQLRTVMKIVGQHDREIRELEAWSCHTYLLSKDSQLAKDLRAAMEAWKSKIPEAGPHPQGPPRWTVAGTVANALVKDGARRAQLGKFVAFHESLSSLEDMESSIQFAVAKETRDGKVLLKLRPQMVCQAEWHEAAAVLREIIIAEGGEQKHGAAPLNPLVRQIEARSHRS